MSAAKLLYSTNFTTYFILKNFHLSAYHLNKAREARFMTKLLGNSKNKRKYLVFKETKNVRVLDEISHNAPKKMTSRRQSVLNNLFMKNITDILVAGNLPFDFLNSGVDITRVSVSPDYSTMNVYYVSKFDVPDLEKNLVETSFYLRHEMSQLRLMGEVPKIQFLKDKNISNLSMLDHHLANIDFGIHEKDFEEEEEITEETLPPMSNNVYGLNFTKIMEKIKQRQIKAKASHRKPVEVIEKPPDEEKLLVSQDKISSIKTKELISKFVKNRKEKS